MKYCHRCNQTKNYSEFYWLKFRQVYQSGCKDCCRASKRIVGEKRTTAKRLPEGATEKHCSTCRTKKPLAEFGKSKTKLSGYSSQCNGCIQIQRRRRYAADPGLRERIKCRQLQYAKQNRQKESERSKAWRKTNPQRQRRLNVAYYASNRAAVLEQKADYNRRKPEVAKINAKNRKARLRGATGKITTEQWKTVLETFNYHCAYCLRPSSDLQMEHMIPIVKKGEHRIDNIIPACLSCNPRKGKRTLLEFVLFEAREWADGRSLCS